MQKTQALDHIQSNPVALVVPPHVTAPVVGYGIAQIPSLQPDAKLVIQQDRLLLKQDNPCLACDTVPQGNVPAPSPSLTSRYSTVAP